MIIHSTKDDPFCLRVEYSHETNSLTRTKETEKFMQDFKKTFRVKKSMSMSRLAKQQDNYNKYYINPQQRYLKKSIDPKKQLANLQNEQFIYRNLHNEKFNKWRHPFADKWSEHIEQRLMLSEENMKQLKKFKNHLESTKKARLPALINELIDHTAT